MTSASLVGPRFGSKRPKLQASPGQPLARWLCKMDGKYRGFTMHEYIMYLT